MLCANLRNLFLSANSSQILASEKLHPLTSLISLSSFFRNIYETSKNNFNHAFGESTKYKNDLLSYATARCDNFRAETAPSQ